MRIGLIAGGGQFPILFSKKAAKNGYIVFAVGFNSETDNSLLDHVQELKWLYLGQVSKLINYFKQHHVTEVVMLGSINKTNIFKDIRPDFKALSFIAKTVRTHDDSVLTAFADLLAKQGIKILPSTFLLPELISPKGCWTIRKPDKSEKKDIVQGWKIAKEIGKLDIGQCIVISNGTILAVEAIEGTDATIKRGGSLSHHNGAVVIKLSKPSQDLRFDLPSSGCETIETMHESGASILVLEAEKSIAFDRKEMIALANKYNISILGYTEDDIT
ncbi:MAG: UDP-2,3-diacylglucosamine diphosphatase LpxI [Proteobacteria bacterium]|nr:UDP-2,3-diacylglucosamine diphosphatase LpxI [Pseudomonadota bacterium]MBU1584374.1 UDP-2,3-diacylglucosamine diphosphatase LpxI [Pseudomonadota bacterium]MBU2453555.1 UDP-2,3-diacylglucosamine diphosphatase LpxI [Pseudomonadota bacterium]MBU2630937.1 UDP-2,3-diacylglucosamine diphosphatase LpxI [Pseudomonadota bacterium]